MGLGHQDLRLAHQNLGLGSPKFGVGSPKFGVGKHSQNAITARTLFRCAHALMRVLLSFMASIFLTRRLECCLVSGRQCCCFVDPGRADDHLTCDIAFFEDTALDFEQSKPSVEAEADGSYNHNDTGDQGKSGKGKGKGNQTLVGNSSAWWVTTLSRAGWVHVMGELSIDHPNLQHLAYR